MQANVQVQILQQLIKEYTAAGIECAFIAPTDVHPYDTMVTLFEHVGGNGKSIRLESNFLPTLNASDGVLLLQSFITLLVDVLPYHQPELLRFMNKMNLILPIGAFGIIEKTNVAFYKHNSVIALNSESPAKQVDVQNGLILHIQQLFFDAIQDVASGERTCEEALSDVNYPHN